MPRLPQFADEDPDDRSAHDLAHDEGGTDDSEGPDPDDLISGEDENDEPVIDCPKCGLEIHESAQRCPYCGIYVTKEDPEQKTGIPLWVWIGVVLALLGSLMWAI